MLQRPSNVSCPKANLRLSKVYLPSPRCPSSDLLSTSLPPSHRTSQSIIESYLLVLALKCPANPPPLSLHHQLQPFPPGLFCKLLPGAPAGPPDPLQSVLHPELYDLCQIHTRLMSPAPLPRTFLSFILFLKTTAAHEAGGWAGSASPPRPPLTLGFCTPAPLASFSSVLTMPSPVTRDLHMLTPPAGTYCPPHSALVRFSSLTCLPVTPDSPDEVKSPHYKHS